MLNIFNKLCICSSHTATLNYSMCELADRTLTNLSQALLVAEESDDELGNPMSYLIMGDKCRKHPSSSVQKHQVSLHK